MTIDELLSLAALTANDEIPVWDAEAVNEPTKKIKAQNLAASVKTLAGLVGEAALTEQLADKADVIVDTASGAIASFPDGAAVPAKDITIGIEPVQSGSGDPSPENVRPISGWTGANVVVSPTVDWQDGTIYLISWQSEAGTVYGGTLDVTTGLLTVTMAEVDLGTLNWITIAPTATIERRFYSSGISSVVKRPPSSRTVTTARCECYAPATDGYVNNAQHYNFHFAIGGDGFIYIRDSRFETTEDFKAAMAGVQLVYELATPQTYQLTPTEVDLLLGENNVWADTGDSTVTYRADTKLYIQKINAPTDDDMIADAQIASGKYFIVGGNLYRSTTTIPAGDAINPGSNCILTNLADALNALNT